MVKKLLISIASGLVVLLVLAGAVLLVLSTRGYFSDVITWLLIGLIGILILFTIYMVITYSIDVVRKKEYDVEALSEQSIQTMLKTGEIPAIKEKKQKSGFSFLFSSSKNPKKKTNTTPPAVAPVPMPTKVSPQEEPVANTAATQTSEADTAKDKTNSTILPVPPVNSAEGEAERQKAVEAVRMQAEAAATARRMAASMAARSQAFPAIKPEQIQSLNNQDATGTPRPDSRAHILNPAKEAPMTGLTQSGSIWEQMNVRQSAAPILEHPDAQRPQENVVPRQTASRITGSYVVSSADLEAASQPWQPPKQPRAWSGGGKMPGDMAAFAKPNTAQTPSDAQTRTKEAREKAKIAEAKIAATKGDASLDSATSLAEDILRNHSLNAQNENRTPLSPPRRGRPPKPKTEEELNAPKRPPGRPPKPKTEEELNAPKRPRGRPPKPKTEEELNAPKRPRGRPRKNPLPEQTSSMENGEDPMHQS